MALQKMEGDMEYFITKLLQFIHCILLLPYYIVLVDKISTRRNKLIVKDCSGEVAVITGGDGCIGSEVTRHLLKRGMHVILGCYNLEDGERFVDSLRREGLTTGTTTVLHLDLDSLESVRIFAKNVVKNTDVLHFIINNAGIIQDEYKETADNFESTWQVNYLGHFLLTHLLLPTVLSTPGRRMIVNVSSMIHKSVWRNTSDFNPTKRQDYDGMIAYSRSKLALLMFTLYLNQKLVLIDSSVQVSAVHPGIVLTNICKPMADRIIGSRYLAFLASFLMKSKEEGALPVIYAVFHAAGGQYIDNCVAQQPSAVSRNKDAQHQLFEDTKQCLNINLFGGLF